MENQWILAKKIDASKQKNYKYMFLDLPHLPLLIRGGIQKLVLSRYT